jgi:hypothetical protein
LRRRNLPLLRHQHRLRLQLLSNASVKDLLGMKAGIREVTLVQMDIVLKSTMRDIFRRVHAFVL